ncbi:hypothetical protein LOK49_LG03G03468 [Camellia lanceoleosa]|uniref:Uncharacterized protein n=1 Tax=Camellia lanceoleosa TaxID=1840588 RepID=A0ACC0ICP9_9ERIC|nr:hypothetical protein LOK49_LG03G03468 [Camellia lanceoleosa]
MSFGTDISMIQLLFPGCTRNQVKLKYKKEECQQPLRLQEALTNRAKVAKLEQGEKGEVESMEPEVSRVQSPVNSYDSEDELCRWSQYKSEF